MNKWEKLGAEELLSMLSDEELMSIKDTVTKSMISTESVSFLQTKITRRTIFFFFREPKRLKPV